MKKNILLIGPLSPPITGNSLANDVVLKGLKKKDFVTIDFINTQFEDFKNDIGKFSLKKVTFILIKYLKLYKVFRADIVYITLGQTFYGVLKYASFIYLASTLKKEIVIHIHGNYLNNQYRLLTGIKKYIFKQILKKSDRGIVLSKSLLDNLTPFLPLDSIYIVPNFVEDYLRPAEFEIIKNESLKIIYLSNLMEKKGVMDVLKALKLLKKKNIPFQARFAGYIERNLETKITSYFDEEDISYMGIVSGNNKKELLEWGNVFILPTYYRLEGVPISILEAMANGNIILTTKHAGIPDIVGEKNGFFVGPNSYKRVADKLIFIESNLHNLKEMRHNNMIDSKKYTEEQFINSLLKIFIN